MFPNFIWITGRYDDEISFSIYDADTILLYSNDNIELANDSIFLTIQNCTPVPCPTPKSFSFTKVTQTSALLTWDAYTQASGYNLIISDSSLTDAQRSIATPIHLTTNSYTVSNMIQGKIYYAYLQNDCSNENSKWNAITFYSDTITLTYKDIDLNFLASGSFADSALLINIQNEIMPACGYRLTLTDTTHISIVMTSLDIDRFACIIDTLPISNLMNPVEMFPYSYNCMLAPDTYYISFITNNQYGDYWFQIEYEQSYHTLDYSRELTIGTTQRGTLKTDIDPYILTQRDKGFSTGYHVRLEQGHSYTFNLSTFAANYFDLNVAISLLIPDSLTGSYNNFENDFLIGREDNYYNGYTQQISTSILYTATTTGDYRLLIQDDILGKEVGYEITIKEVNIITLDSLLRTAVVLDYATNLPYIEYGTFDVNTVIVEKDSLFRSNYSPGFFHAKAYRIDLNTGDSLMAGESGLTDFYMYLYEGNANDGYQKLEQADDNSNTFNEYIEYVANKSETVYVVLTTYDYLKEGNWQLQIVKNGDSFTEDTVHVKLVASNYEITPVNHVNLDEVLDELKNIKLGYATLTDTTEIFNNYYLWNIDLINRTATYTCYDVNLPANHSFDNNNSVQVTWLSSNIENIELEKEQLIIYPNPAHDVCYIQSHITTGRLIVYDLTGRIVLNQPLSGMGTETINVSHFNTGIYQIRIGNKVAKLIVQ